MKNWIERLPFEDPVRRKQATLLQAFLFGIILALSIAMVLNVLFFGTDALTLRGLGPNLSFLILTIGMLAVLRSGRFEVSVTALIAALLIGLTQMVISDGLSNNLGSLVTFFLPVTLAGLLVGRRTMLLTIVATLLIILLRLETERETVTDSTAISRAVTIFLIVFSLFCFVLDRFGITLRHALAVAQQREEALRNEIEKSRRTETRLAILQDITAALSSALSQREVADVIVGQGLNLVGGHVATVCLLTSDRTQFEIVNKSGIPDSVQEEYRFFSVDSPTPVADAVRQREPIWIDTRQQYLRRYPQFAKNLLENGTHAAAFLPLEVNTEILGGISISFPHDDPFNVDTKNLLIALSQHCAQAMHRARLYELEHLAREAAQAAHRRVRFLAEASAELAASLDYEMTLQKVAQLCASPENQMGEWCGVYVLEKDGKINPLAVAHQDPARVELARQFLTEYPPDPHAKTGVAEVLRTGLSSSVPVVTEEMWAAAARDERQLELLHDLNLRSGLIVPIQYQGKVFGALSMASEKSGLFADPSYITLAEELAQRAAIAIQNSHSYHDAATQREQWRVTLASIGDAVIATDVNGRVSFMNSVAHHLTGWTEADVVGVPLTEVFRIVNENTWLPVESPFKKVVETGRIVGLANHTLLIAKDGRVIPIDDSGAPIFDPSGDLIGVILVFRDITERRATERARQDQLSLVEALLDTALDISGALELEDVLEGILVNVEKVIPHDTASIYLMEAPEEPIIRSRSVEEGSLMDFELAVEESTDPLELRYPFALMLDKMRPVFVPSTSQEARWVEAFPTSAIRSYLGAPIVIKGKVAGFLNLTSRTSNFFTPDHASRLQLFATQAAIAIQNAQLHLQAQETAVLEERQRFARELHDAVTQTLFASSMIAESVLRSQEFTKDNLYPQLERLIRLNRGALAEMRTLLLELRQANPAAISFSDLLTQLTEAAMGHQDIEMELKIEGQIYPVPPAVHVTFYRIAQEALNNIIKHAQASHVLVLLQFETTRLTLQIKDDGRGFRADQIDSNRFGLRIMVERASKIDAKLDIVSEVGQGTEIILRYPR